MLMRSELRDSRLGPFENKATNPQFARALAGSTVVRRNLYNGTAQPTGSGATMVRGVVVDGRSGDTFEQSTTAASPIYRFRVNLSDLVNGVVYTASATVKNIGTSDISVTPDWCDVTTSGNGPFTIKPGETMRVATKPAARSTYDATYSFADILVNTLGGKMHVSEQMIEARPGLLPFFSGATVNDRGIAYSWDGTAGASTASARASVAEVRRNYLPNPDAVATGQAWQIQVPAGHTVTASYETPVGVEGVSCAVLTVNTSDGTQQQFRMRVGGSGVNVNGTSLSGAASVTVAVSFDFWASSLLVGKVISVEIPIVGPPSAASTFRNSFTFTPTASGWSRVEAVINLIPQQTLTGIDYIQTPQVVTPYMVVPADTLLFRMGRAILEIAPAKLGPYFSGSVTPDADLTPSWVGTANAGNSALSAVRVDGTSGNAQTQIAWLWNSNAARSLPTTASQDTAVRFSGEFNGFQFGMLPGRTYTLMMRVRVLAAQINPGSQARRIVTYWYNGTSHITVVGTQQAPNVPGVYDIRAVWTVPLNASQSFARLYDSGAAIDFGKIQFERFQVVEGKYDGGFFDGDSKDCIWRGPAHASPSVGYPPLALAA